MLKTVFLLSILNIKRILLLQLTNLTEYPFDQVFEVIIIILYFNILGEILWTHMWLFYYVPHVLDLHSVEGEGNSVGDALWDRLCWIAIYEYLQSLKRGVLASVEEEGGRKCSLERKHKSVLYNIVNDLENLETT